MRVSIPFFAILASVLVAVPALAGDAESGERLYEEMKCNVCHTLAGVSGPMAKFGGPLDRVGDARDEAWLRSYLTEPTSVMPEAKMQPVKASKEKIDHLVAYMLSLRGPEAATQSD